jgi:hypothetical protein
MKSYKLFFIAFAMFCILCFSCQRKPKAEFELESKSDLIERDLLIPMIKEVLVLEASLYFKANQGADMKTMTTVYYNQLFEKYNTDREQFYRSVKFYVQQGDEHNNLFTEVVNILTVESDSVRKENAESVIDKEEKIEENADTISRGGIFRRIVRNQEQTNN